MPTNPRRASTKKAAAAARLGTAKRKAAGKRPASKAAKATAAVSDMRLTWLNHEHAGWVPEFRFHETRRWRFDYAHPVLRIALEVEGGVWSGGRHTRGAGFLGDIEKYNTATAAGWSVFRCTTDGCSFHETRLLIAGLIKIKRQQWATDTAIQATRHASY